MIQGDTPPTAGTVPSEDGGGESTTVTVVLTPPEPVEPDWAAKGDGAPESVPPVEATVAPEPELPTVDNSPVEATPGAQVRVSVAGPFWAHSFTSDAKLTIDRSGVLVDEADVASLIASADAAGIALKVG